MNGDVWVGGYWGLIWRELKGEDYAGFGQEVEIEVEVGVWNEG